ncbi:class II fructose-bisphosphate aldolase [Opitutaceae bacterium TAV4]|nr:class II fructose-bisphosphate aldolase [Opitutaceae bacterium TAV4]RRK02267.1 class II fructose-bisphosphate aldolase [Opitutaceae bacterium TAV3]
MPLVTMNELLPAARAEGKAVCAFNFADSGTAEAVVDAAIAEKRPLILQVYQRLLGYPHIDALIAMARKLAESSPVPVAVHLDHGASLDQVRKAIDIGFTSVMLDGSTLSLKDNIDVTRQGVELAHRAGLSIEGEIGHVPANDRQPTPYSDPAEVELFARETGVDALAVAVGTAHGFYTEPPKVSVEVAEAVSRRISIPMVLHGGSDTPRDKVRAIVRCGFAKVNIATEFQYAYEQQLKRTLDELGQKFQAVDLVMKPAIAKASAHAAEIIRYLGT